MIKMIGFATTAFSVKNATARKTGSPFYSALFVINLTIISVSIRSSFKHQLPRLVGSAPIVLSAEVAILKIFLALMTLQIK